MKTDRVMHHQQRIAKVRQFITDLESELEQLVQAGKLLKSIGYTRRLYERAKDMLELEELTGKHLPDDRRDLKVARREEKRTATNFREAETAYNVFPVRYNPDRIPTIESKLAHYRALLPGIEHELEIAKRRISGSKQTQAVAA